MDNPIDYFIERVERYQTPLGNLSVRHVPGSRSLEVVLATKWRGRPIFASRVLDTAYLRQASKRGVAGWALKMAEQVLASAAMSFLRSCDEQESGSESGQSST
jgi:hypothetical protein